MFDTLNNIQAQQIRIDATLTQVTFNPTPLSDRLPLRLPRRCLVARLPPQGAALVVCSGVSLAWRP